MASQGYSSPTDLEAFKLKVWAFVQQIPVGKVITYGQVAAWIGAPEGMDPVRYRAFGPRWVGGAIAACPPGVPWQRVINAQGKISLPGKAGVEQRELLEAEGVQFDPHGRVDLKRFGWDPSSAEQMKLF
ncbi:MAG: MGMT family protein [Anaerolineales bacterium]|jgi:methylated-DNA-protein-cysteine methyltransferase-like protein|nr:MGMT family protein [Anaerolineales bacterium]